MTEVLWGLQSRGAQVNVDLETPVMVDGEEPKSLQCSSSPPNIDFCSGVGEWYYGRITLKPTEMLNDQLRWRHL